MAANNVYSAHLPCAYTTFPKVPETLQATQLVPDKFNFFPKLPIEIRLKIWKMTFPRQRRRYVSISRGNNVPDAEFSDKVLPVALFVHSESRQEALKYYGIIYPGAPLMRRRRFLKAPIYIDPAIDCVVAGAYGMLNNWGAYGGFLEEWLPYLASRIPGGLGAIRELELDNLVWRGGVANAFDISPLSTLSRYSPLLQFTGLKTLYLSTSYEYNLFEENTSRIHNTVKAFLEHHKAVFTGGQIPEIVLRQITESYDESNSNGQLTFCTTVFPAPSTTTIYCTGSSSCTCGPGTWTEAGERP